MSDEWKELNSIVEVAEAVAAGMEIEVQTDPGNDKYCPWKWWDGKVWYSSYLFRARPCQPKTVKVVSLCWRSAGGNLTWAYDEVDFTKNGWVRFPAGDIEGEVEV